MTVTNAGIKPAAIGSAVRLHTASRENVQTKARRLLVEGRVMLRYVGPNGVQAFVRGSATLHRVNYRRDAGWSCTCPSPNRAECSHVLAVQAVVVVGED